MGEVPRVSSDAPNVIIRHATVDDCPEIARLIRELADYEGLSDQVKSTQKDLEEDGFGTLKFFRCLVAENQESDHEKKLIGYALFYNKYSTFYGRSLYLEDLYVCKDFRGHKIGLRLFAAIAQIAVEEKCHHIDFVVLSWNESSIQFYKKIGAENLTEKENWHRFRVEGIQHLANLNHNDKV